MRAWFMAVLLSAAGALAVAWPAVQNPTDTILCNFVHPDCLSNHWLLVWMAEQIGHWRTILHNDQYYWPEGDSPWLAGNGSEGFLYAPWHWLLGWPLASNVHLVLILVLNGVAAYTLARASGGSPWGSLAAAPTGSMSVYVSQELGAGRFSQVSVCWVLFFLAAWQALLRRPSIGRAAVAAVLLSATSLFYWYYGLFGGMAAVLLGVVHLRRTVPQRYGPAAWTFLGGVLLTLGPLLAVFLTNWSAIPGTGEDAFPHPESFNDSTFMQIPFLVHGGRHSGLALPFTTCLLALFAPFHKVDRRTTVAWFLIGTWFALLMAGGRIPNGPYEWVYGLAAPLRRFWWPYRHVVLVNAAFIVLAARGADAWSKRPVWGIVVALSIPLQLTVQDAPWHTQFSRANVPDPFYSQLAADPSPVLLEPPLAPEVASAQTPLIYQFFHHKRLFSGHALWVARVRPPAWDERVAANSFLREMQRLELGELDGTFTFEATDLRSLEDDGVRLIVLNREYFPSAMAATVEAYDAVFRALFGEPTLTGKRAKAWSTDGWNGTTSATFTPFRWPSGLHPGGPTLALQAPRPPGSVFSIPPPPR